MLQELLISAACNNLMQEGKRMSIWSKYTGVVFAMILISGTFFLLKPLCWLLLKDCMNCEGLYNTEKLRRHSPIFLFIIIVVYTVIFYLINNEKKAGGLLLGKQWFSLFWTLWSRSLLDICENRRLFVLLFLLYCWERMKKNTLLKYFSSGEGKKNNRKEKPENMF